MYYIVTKRKDGKYGVKDTKDNVTCYLTKEELIHSVPKGIKVVGFKGRNSGEIEVCSTSLIKLLSLEKGMPCVITLRGITRQVIYCGITDDCFFFFDGTVFKFTPDYILGLKDDFKIDLVNNDAVKVASLLKMLNS